MLVASVLLVLGFGPIQAKKKPPITFDGVQYVWRYAEGATQAYTPKDQANLSKFTDMVIVRDQPEVKTSADVVSCTDRLVQSYEREGANVMTTQYFFRGKEAVQECLVVVVFETKKLCQAGFTRYALLNGKGKCFTYTRRYVGDNAARPLAIWIKKNKESMQKKVMAQKL